MLNFLPITIDRRDAIHPKLYAAGRLGCEYSFANLLFWMSSAGGFAEAAGFVCVRLVWKNSARYLFPAGIGDPTGALELLRLDAAERGEPFRLAGVTERDKRLLEMFYP